MNAKRMQAAVNQCLAKCSDSKSWYSCWAEFIESLFNDPSWSIDDVVKLHQVMLYLLAFPGRPSPSLKPDRSEIDHAICLVLGPTSREFHSEIT